MLEPSNTNMQHTLTRYLYPKELVKASLVWAILDQKVDETLFWGYELYYSGFRAETFDLIISTYVMYFKEKHPQMKPYLCRQLEKWYSQEENTTKKFMSHDTIIGSILRNMASRTVSLTTIFRFRLGIVPNSSGGSATFEVSSEEATMNVSPLPENDSDDDDVAEDPLLLPDLTPYEIKPYKTNYEIPSSKTICNLAIFPIRTQYCNILDDDSPSSYNVFELSTRLFEKTKTMEQFSYHDWLYHASGSPIWKTRISLHGGKICHGTQQIVFMDEDQEEQFYNKYDYEIDEQSCELRDKLFGKEWPNFSGGSATFEVSSEEATRNVSPLPDSNTYISWECFYDRYGSDSIFTQVNIIRDFTR